MTNLLHTKQEIIKGFEMNEHCVSLGIFRNCEVFLEKHFGSYKVTIEDPEIKGFFHVLKTGTLEETTDYYLTTLGCFQ